MTFPKLLLGLYHRLVLIWVDNLTKAILVVNKLLTAQGCPVVCYLFCLPNIMLFRRLPKFLMNTLSLLVITRVKFFEGLVLAIGILTTLVDAMGNRAIICAIGDEFLILFELVGDRILILTSIVLSKRWLMIVAIVTKLLLRTWLVDYRVNVARLVGFWGVFWWVKLLIYWGRNDILPFDNTDILFCGRLRWLLYVAFFRTLTAASLIERRAYLVVS